MKNYRLVKARKKNQMTQMDLAIKLGYKGKQSIANWENGHSSPPLHMALKTSELLDEDVHFLFGHNVQVSHTFNNEKNEVI